jgi:hypothetical protein
MTLRMRFDMLFCVFQKEPSANLQEIQGGKFVLLVLSFVPVVVVVVVVVVVPIRISESNLFSFLGQHTLSTYHD